MTRSLVQGSLRPVWWSIAAFSGAATMSAGLSGAVVATIAPLARETLGGTELHVTASAISVVLAACDWGAFGLRVPSLPWQTAAGWWYEFGPHRAWVAWGLHLGLGAWTIRATSLFWMLLVLALLVVPVGLVPFVVSSYGLGLGIGLTFAVARPGYRAECDRGARTLLAGRHTARQRSSILLSIVAVALAIESIVLWTA